MPIADDDNPFQRPSAWPRMPQAPFRIGVLPQIAAPRPAPAIRPVAAPKPQTEAGASAPSSLFGAGPMGGALTRPAAAAPGAEDAARQPEPAPAPPIVELPVVEPAAPSLVAVNDDGFAAPPVPTSASPFAATRRAKPRAKSRAPLIAAGVVGVTGVAGLTAFIAMRGPEPSPALAAAPQVAATTPAAAGGPAAPSSPAAATLTQSASEPAPAPRPARLASTARRAAARAGSTSGPMPEIQLAAPAPTPSAVVAPTPVALPAIPPAAAGPAPVQAAPVQAVTPRPAPADPAAPISTKPTYSE